MSSSQQAACRTAASVAVLALSALVAAAIVHPRAPASVVLLSAITAIVALSLTLLPLTLHAADKACPQPAATAALTAGLVCLLVSWFGLGVLAGHAGWTSVITVR